MVVGFAHALVGMGKIRMSEVNDKKNQIQQCTCPFHLREQNKDMWRSTEDFMTAVLCSPINFEEFKNPEISQYSHEVQEEMACAIKKERVDMNQRHLSFTNTCKLPRVRAKGSKSEVAIKPGRQDGKLLIFKRSCAYGECHDCGVEKYFTSHKCPLEWDEELQVNIKEYQDLARNNSDEKQKELVSVTVTAKEVMQKIADTAGNVIKHLWQSRWGSHMRRYDYCQANALHLALFMYDSHDMMLTNHIHVLIIIVYLSLGIELQSETSPYKTITI
jgi:hypothetical protein